MSKRAKQGETGRPGRRTWRVILAAAIVVGLAGGALWLWLASREADAGTPRLAVDRTEVDLGYQRFDTLARVVFTLTNAGDGPLRLSEVPRVRVAAGC